MSNSRDTPSVFNEIYHTNKWRGSDSISGPGSNLAATEALRQALPLVVRALDVAVMLDAPCGDLHWMRDVDLGVDRYVGVDVVFEVVDRARQLYDRPSEFFTADITVDSLPRADLIFCRDCIGHLSDDLGLRALRNMQSTGSTYLMTTTFYSLEENTPGSTGGWRPINLQRPPFSFPPPLFIVPERAHSPHTAYSDKSMGVWRLQDLALLAHEAGSE